MRPHVSYSELLSFATQCQWRWKLEYLDGKRRDINSVHFDFGLAAHAALERYLTRDDPVDVDRAVQIFKERFATLVAKNSARYHPPISAEFQAELLDAGERIVRYVRSTPELQDIELLHNEFPLFEKIELDGGLDVKFKGYIDLVFKGKSKRGGTVLWIVDFKTCSWGWDRDTRQDRWKHYQLFLYKHFLCKKFDLDPSQVRTAFVLLKKRPPKDGPPVEFFPVSAGPVSVQRALDALGSNINEMAQREKDTSFRKDRSQCRNDFGEVCPFYNTPDCPGKIDGI